MKTVIAKKHNIDKKCQIEKSAHTEGQSHYLEI